MKRIFAILFAIVILAGAFVALQKSELFVNFFDGVPKTVEEYDPEAYYYKNLSSDTSKKAYNMIMGEIFTFPEKILIPSLSDPELDEVYEAILYDNPRLFFLESTCHTQMSGSKNYFYPEYSLEGAEYLTQFAALEKAEDEIVSKAPRGDEFETELYLHNAVLKTCVYSEGVSGETSSPYSCLVEKKASCEGYAKAMKRLLEKCGIECFLAVGQVDDGKGSTEGHMWDIVRINGKYYHLDPTWDDNNNDDLRPSYTYFNDNDSLISKTHVVTDRYAGICTSIDDNYYRKTNAFFASYDGAVRNKISGMLSRNADSGSDLVTFMFENEDDYKNAKQDLFDNEKIYRLLDRADLATDKTLVTDRVYFWNDDKFFVINIFNYF